MVRDIKLTLLERARVASPCPARWEDMVGSDTVRHCGECRLQVHNLSAMTQEQAQNLLARHFAPDGSPLGERFCAAFYKRADGTILTRDCPVGLAKIRAAAKRALVRIAAAVGMLSGIGAALAWAQRAEVGGGRLRGLEPLAALSRWMAPHSLPPLAVPRLIKGEMVIGKVAPMVAPAPMNPPTGSTP